LKIIKEKKNNKVKPVALPILFFSLQRICIISVISSDVTPSLTRKSIIVRLSTIVLSS
jgi:hypothetical protein